MDGSAVEVDALSHLNFSLRKVLSVLDGTVVLVIAVVSSSSSSWSISLVPSSVLSRISLRLTRPSESDRSIGLPSLCKGVFVHCVQLRTSPFHGLFGHCNFEFLDGLRSSFI